MPEIPERWELGVYFDAYTDEMAMDIIAAICEGVIQANAVWMGAVGLDAVPCCLADAEVRYIDPPGCSRKYPCQKILSAPVILQRKVATCIDIACYICAYRRLRGEQGNAVVINMLDMKDRPIKGQYHVVVDTGMGIHDYTEDLIHGRLAQCRADCLGD